MGKLVELSATMRPSANLTIEGAAHSGSGLAMFLKIVAMPIDERRQIVADQAQDEMVVWFALLTPHDRREFLAAAGRDMKLRMVEEVGRAAEKETGNVER